MLFILLQEVEASLYLLLVASHPLCLPEGCYPDRSPVDEKHKCSTDGGDPSPGGREVNTTGFPLNDLNTDYLILASP